jgi:hypothetical protein
MRFGESDVNVTALGTLLWVLGMAQRGSKAAQPFPFARAHRSAPLSPTTPTEWENRCLEPPPLSLNQSLSRWLPGGATDSIPLSQLSLDLPEPVGGWAAYLKGRGIDVVTDDIGRASIARADARQLLNEYRSGEAEKARRRKLAEAQAVADDQLRRAQIWQGVPADHMPPGVPPAAAMLQTARDAQPKRTTPLEEALANSGTLTYHALSKGDES